MLTRVILAIDDPPLLRRMRRVMSHPDVIVESVRVWEKLLEQLGRESYDLAVVGQHLLQGRGAEAIASLRQLPDSPEVVVLCDREDPEEQARWLAAECSSVLYAGLSDKAMREVLSTILNRRRETVEKGLAVRPGAVNPLLSDFVSDSPAMQAFMGVVQRVAASDTSLLLTGETGVGKEHLARSIHAESARARGPFIAVNCGALPDALLESELFGHEEGAFTGASRARRGWFELSHRGTIFLDEIGEMPLHLQVKLLQVLQTREVRRVLVGPRVPIGQIADSPEQLVGLLSRFSIELSQGGDLVASGRGSDVLDSPLHALSHLVRQLGSRGLALSPGDIITTGALTDAQPLASGQQWHTRLEGLGLAGLTLKVGS